MTTTQPTPTATDLALIQLFRKIAFNVGYTTANYHDPEMTAVDERQLDELETELIGRLAARGLPIAGPGQTTDTITISRKEETVKNPDANLTDDEQVLFDVRDAIAGAHKDDGTVVGAYAAIDAIRRMHNMGLVARRKHERREPEPDLSFLNAALSATDDQPAEGEGQG